MLRLAVRVARAQAELVLAELLELVPAGVEEVDAGEAVVEYAVYGAPGELPELPALRAAAGGALVEVTTTEIADDWAERWREFHRPLILGGRLSVRPPWWAPCGTAVDLVIDPGRAFGTGAHATTRLCLELLLELEPAGAAVDLGSGSGVLAIAAAALGWGPVLAVDLDPLAVAATAANALVNGVELDARRAELRELALPPARLALANLLAPLLLAWAARLRGAAEPPAIVIASGLLRAEADAVAGAFAAAGLEQRDRRARGDWSALLLRAR
jgi:ribosomal protein L11 methyltransferase